MDSLTCRTCGKVYPATKDHFYTYSTGRFQRDCKDCFKAKRREYRPTKMKAVHKGEILAIERLRLHGIYCASGKTASAMKWIDIVAWGCVKIEVKYTVEAKMRPVWRWNLSSTNNPKTQAPDLIMLIGERLTGQRHYYLFPATHPVFFKGQHRKKGIVYTIDSHQPNKHTGYISLTSDLMVAHEERYNLIEEERQRIIKAMMVIA